MPQNKNIESVIDLKGSKGKVVILHQSAPAFQAARAMCERGIGCVIVCDAVGKMVGIVTDRDLACEVVAFPKNSEFPLSEFMSADPVSVTEDAPIDEVIHLMKENGIRRIPVVRDEKCVGVVTLDDLIATELVDQHDLSEIVRAQIPKHPKNYPKGDREARSEQKLNLFYKRIGEKIHLDEEMTIRVTQFLLKSLIRRLHFTGASHLIAQLPRDLQEDLYNLPAGPDRSVSVGSMMSGLISQLQIPEKTAHLVLVNWFSGFAEMIDPHEIQHVKSQLPEEMRILLDQKLRAIA